MKKLPMFEKNPFENEDPMWTTRMQMLMRRKRSMEIAQIIEDSLHQYYVVEKGVPVPQWRQQKNPQWWVDYLIELGLDPSNP
jgi:hypothetical protein|tara:strand:+ start:1288 stop:1533 length:246 start_codon:yes stop_codon:yes gene_type:complete